MKVLITGGMGFMGSHMVRHLIEQYPNYTILNIDKLTYAGNPDNLKDLENEPRLKNIQADITDEETMEEIVASERPDAIINYAAETHVDRSILDPGAFLKTDIIGVHTILELVKKYNIERFIHISTDEVYGSIEQGEFVESSPFRPNSPYSASKAGADHMCRAYWMSYQIPVIVTHSCNVYGPYQHPEKVIPLFIISALSGKALTIHGSGRQIREWIYAKDHCRAIDTILHKGCDGEVYNIGTGKRRSIVEIAKLILEFMSIEKNENTLHLVKDRPGQDHRYATNFNKIELELDWVPTMSFEEGLRHTITWYKGNVEWWQKILSGEFRDYHKRIQEMYNTGVHFEINIEE